MAEYDDLTDVNLKAVLINALKKEYPNDFRILLRYMTYLIHFEEKSPDVVAKIIATYENIQQNCNIDKIRISAKRHIIELYRSISEDENSRVTFTDCEKIINEMPRMRDGQEMLCSFYPQNHPERDEKIRQALEEELLLLHTTYFNYLFRDERFSAEWQAEAIQKEIDFLNFIYDDGNYGKMWRTVICNYFHIGVRNFQSGDSEKALHNFTKCAELAKKFDNMSTVTEMCSTLFKNREFNKNTLGSPYIASSHIKELFEKCKLSDEFKSSEEFERIIKILD